MTPKPLHRREFIPHLNHLLQRSIELIQIMQRGVERVRDVEDEGFALGFEVGFCWDGDWGGGGGGGGLGG
ncbi:hypothetical protein GRF29_154g46215 [Pseudopithomyces chartarum]|uniref:Uncharacterized protein n=1 Tax=Pseudopithomyces chartarum TaxID=1892770 RepID=A0AAN6LTM8_9PLEO|nr:hypothetical protein GRF29_154g46215 [Pseudopithomyces chartarum]